MRTSHGELVQEIERRLRVLDVVIKYQTVRLDEDLKRQKKLGAQARTARRAASAAHARSAPAPARRPAPAAEQPAAS